MKQGPELGSSLGLPCGLDGCYGSVDRPKVLAPQYYGKNNI
jgi:hypothetical protein